MELMARSDRREPYAGITEVAYRYDADFVESCVGCITGEALPHSAPEKATKDSEDDHFHVATCICCAARSTSIPLAYVLRGHKRHAPNTIVQRSARPLREAPVDERIAKKRPV